MGQTERTYYLVVGAYNLSWAFLGPVYTIFLLDAGLDLFEVNLVLATYFVTSFCFEVPTGAVADVFGRKVSFLASCLIRSGAFYLYFVADSLALFLLAEAIDAVGNTLASGALDAWAVDGTRREGFRHAPDQLLSRGWVAANVAMIVSGLAGGYLGQMDLRLPWLAGAGCFLLTAALAVVTMRETRPPRDAGRRSAVARQARQGLGAVRAHPVLMALCALTMLSGVATMPVLHYWPPFLEAASSRGTWVLGWVWVLLGIVNVATSLMVPRLVAFWGRGRVAAGAALLRGASVLLAAGSGRFGLALTGVAGHSVGMSCTIPVVDAWLNLHVGERERATVLSVNRMAFTLGAAVGLVVLGLVARATDIATAWTCAAVIFLGCAVGLAATARIEARK